MASMQVTARMQPQNGTLATMTNKTPSRMILDRFHNWSGVSATGEFPPNIDTRPIDEALFTHLKGGQFGSSGAVQYSGSNADSVPCAWILAWHAPSDNTPPQPPNRVYAICGLKTQIDAMSWEHIREKLEASPTNATFIDYTSKTIVNAAINDFTANVATLSASFGLIP